jgi:hypothetical protein
VCCPGLHPQLACCRSCWEQTLLLQQLLLLALVLALVASCHLRALGRSRPAGQHRQAW